VIFRSVRRAVALGLALALSIIRFWLLRMRGPLSMQQRALWVQQTCRGILAGVGIHYRVEGTPPTHGLVVSNHLSYLDILIIGAATPCFFVAKAEIGGWPFFGEAARIGGTLFIDRASLASAQKVSAMIAERFSLNVPILFFPEGTTTDGASLLRFHSRLFDPAAVAGVPVTAVALGYVIEDGTPESELCWIGDDAFLPHLWKALGTAGFSASVRFGQPRIYPDRRTAADQTHAEVAAMRVQLPLP
jgi:1-acyl-sn-glycerol-3-phosphate acyltransferase